MDPTDILNVCFHIGGDFIRIGPILDYVGGDEVLSGIERDKLSLQEVKGFLKDHIALKDSMKLYFLIPGKYLVNGLVFLCEDSACMKMADYVCVGGVPDLFVEYHGEEDIQHISSGSDYEDEMMDVSDGDQADAIISAEPAESSEEEFEENILVPDDTCVITEVIKCPVWLGTARRQSININSDVAASQIYNQTQPTEEQQLATEEATMQHLLVDDLSGSDDSDSDPEYMPHSEDTGENSEVVELRRHARNFKKRMRKPRAGLGEMEMFLFQLISWVTWRNNLRQMTRIGILSH
jgi:hypothetical protein